MNSFSLVSLYHSVALLWIHHCVEHCCVLSCRHCVVRSLALEKNWILSTLVPAVSEYIVLVDSEVLLLLLSHHLPVNDVCLIWAFEKKIPCHS
jgi:hypothetical protein